MTLDIVLFNGPFVQKDGLSFQDKSSLWLDYQVSSLARTFVLHPRYSFFPKESLSSLVQRPFSLPQNGIQKSFKEGSDDFLRTLYENGSAVDMDFCCAVYQHLPFLDAVTSCVNKQLAVFYFSNKDLSSLQSKLHLEGISRSSYSLRKMDY